MSGFVAKWMLGASLLIALTGCDPTYSVFVRNAMPMPIKIKADFKGEPIRQVTLEPGRRMAFVHVKGDLQDLVIASQNRNLYELDRAGILLLLAGIDGPDSVVWVVSENGIRALSPAADSRLYQTSPD